MKSPILFCAMVLTLSLGALHAVDAGSATWNLNPTSGDWNTATNWTPNTVPNGPTDVATFGVSNQTSVSISGVAIELSSLVFDSGASAFTIAVPLPGLTLSGIGIVNNSGVLQTFVGTAGGITFTQNATAGEMIAYTNAQGIVFYDNASAGSGTFTREGNLGGYIDFFDNTTADHATLTNNPGFVSALEFYNNSTAGNATIINEGSDYYLYTGSTLFHDTSTAGDGLFIADGSFTNYYGNGGVGFIDSSKAGNGTFIANGGQVLEANGGVISLYDSSTAENGTFIANGTMVSGAFGGRVTFNTDSAASAATLIAKAGIGIAEGCGGGLLFNTTSTGDTARVELFGNGFLDLRGHETPELTIGSLEGDGLVFLGRANLSVGSNNLSTTFSGLIEENSEGTIGALTKTGAGMLELSGANTNAGGTTVDAGGLVINNTTGSGTGTGAVQVNGGILAGSGIITGQVTVGTGSGTGAFLTPGMGASTATTLTIQSALTFKADGTYTCRLNTKKTKTDQLIANGVTIESGAQFAFKVTGDAQLRTGKTATVISNTSATPISGTFANLPDGSTFIVGPNTFQVSYEGGDGNDLTLTVIP